MLNAATLRRKKLKHGYLCLHVCRNRLHAGFLSRTPGSISLTPSCGLSAIPKAPSRHLAVGLEGTVETQAGALKPADRQQPKRRAGRRCWAISQDCSAV